MLGLVTWPEHPPGVYNFGVVRRYGTRCNVNKFYVNNNRFHSRNYNDNMDLEIPQPLVHGLDLRYRTHYGWNFAHNGVIYHESSHNLMLACRRNLACRNPDGNLIPEIAVEYDRVMRENQINFIREKEETLVKMFEGFHWNPPPHEKVYDAIICAAEPHPKQKIRAAAILELDRKGKLYGRWSSSVLWKMKLDEYAKPGKYPRVIVDLGVAASLEGAKWIEKAKCGICDKIVECDGWYFVFCGSPDPDNVMRYLDIIWNNRMNARGYTLAFSDDAVIGTYVNGVWKVYNLDISTCDASHTPALFNLMCKLLSIPEDLKDDLWAQITADIRVGVKDGDPAFLRCHDFYLQSGSIITTLINTIAQMVITVALATSVALLHSDDIINCVKGCGYDITLEECIIEEDMQFLKMSPCRDIFGNFHACLNLGVILRASGTCRGDIPRSHRKIRDIRIDAACFQHKLMCGMLTRIDNADLNKLSPYPLLRGETSLVFAQKVVDSLRYMTVGPVIRYSDDIYTRYRLTAGEVSEIKLMLSSQNFGTVMYSSGVNKILLKDYGLSCPIPANYQ